MGLNLGSSAVSLKLGSQSVVGYLGSQIVTASVPGAPTITSAVADVSSTTVNYTNPASDGGSAITSFKYYINDVETIADGSESVGQFVINTNFLGQDVQVSAVNAIGEGPRSAVFVVT